MTKTFKCIHCGISFIVELEEDANYGSEPNCCDECLCHTNAPEDYLNHSDADPGL